jgi:hypothetical protein
MDADAITRLSEVDDYRALTLLDVVRSELKAATSAGRPAASVIEPATLFAALRSRLVKPPRPSEEVVLAVIQLLVEYVHVGERSALAGVPTVVGELLPMVGRDRIRRAAGVLLAALVKRAPATAADVTATTISAGIGHEDVRYERGPGRWARRRERDAMLRDR